MTNSSWAKGYTACKEAMKAELEYNRNKIERLEKALQKIAFITEGLDTPNTSNAAHYEAVNALNYKEPQ